MTLFLSHKKDDWQGVHHQPTPKAAGQAGRAGKSALMSGGRQAQFARWRNLVIQSVGNRQAIIPTNTHI